jgi:hypothetical protein
LIAVAHETGAPVSGEVVVENARISDGALLFSRYDGGALVNAIVKAETSLRLEVPVRTPVLIRAQVEVSPAKAVSRGEVHEELGISKGTLMADLKGSGRAAVRVRVPEGMRVSGMTWNGAAAQFSEADGAAQVSLELGAEGRLEAQFASLFFALADDDLLDFPFVKDGTPGCVIVARPNASEIERTMAYRVQEYFRYWYGRASKPAVEVVIPIQESDKPAEGCAVVLSVRGGEASRVALKGRQLLITAPDAVQLKALVFRVLRALDRKYSFFDLVIGTPLNKKLRLADSVLE